MIGVVALIIRLFYWQIIEGARLSDVAAAQQTNRQTLNAKRGRILASDGSVLTASAPTWNMFLYRPESETKEPEIITRVTPLLVPNSTDMLAISSESARLQSILSNASAQWLPLKNHMSREQKSAIESLKIKGIGFDQTEARMYPEASMSAHILGFVGKADNGEDIGYFGLEGNYDLLLSGKSGVYETEANALGAPIVTEDDVKLSSFSGVDLRTSIEKRIQLSVEKHLRDGLAKYEADAGTITVMDPKTGEILAMAAFPSYDPGKYFESDDSLFRNPIISDSFEPGSIMKPIVMASAFDAGLINPATECDICSGPYHTGPYVIRTWNNQYYANTTMADVIKHSDNVGMVFIGNKLGTPRLYEYLSKFGFGTYTGIDLQGEFDAPMRKKEEWGEVERHTASFGQGIAVTPIQMLSAISVIANKGISTTPHVVKAVELGSWKKEKRYPQGKRVISEEASNQITSIMVNAVSQGEAKWAVPKGYEHTFAGKTGTAQIAVEGKYDEEKTNASFIGFAPANDPRFAMLITLKQPKTSPWASETAAPLWFQTAADLMRYLGIPPKQ